MQQSFFDITPNELAQLGPELAVDVMREILWAEASNLGIPITDVEVPFAITTADGGVDAVVNGTPKSAGNGVIFPPKTSYQVKVGDFTLTPNTGAEIEKLLLSPKAIEARKKANKPISGSSYTVGDISPRIRECLDAGGTFVTALFGNEAIDVPEAGTEDAIKKFLGEIDAKYGTANVRVWRAPRICGILRLFPAVSLKVKNIQNLQLYNHAQWASQPEMQRQFVIAPDQHKLIDNLRAALRDDSQGMIQMRLLGEPGIGKTRLVLEALRADDLEPLSIYAEKGSVVNGQVIGALRAAQGARIVLVVDECSPEQRSNLMSTFSQMGPQFKIVSIYQDYEESDGASEYRLLEMPALQPDKIEAILTTYGVDPAIVKGWAELCGGSPRVAHVVGQNLRDHPEDPLKSDGISRVWVRYLARNDDPDSEAYRKRHLVMSTLSLFTKFGWGVTVRSGAFEIYDLIVAKLDAGISKAEFSTIIDQMAGRKILQGDNFLYITPRALQLKLWTDWWNQFGANVNMIEIIPQLSQGMRQWFAEMIEYASASPISKKLVASLLGPKGLYANAEWLNTKDGGRFFFSLSLADPLNALRLLERTVGKMSREELLLFEGGRRDVVWALENLALHGEYFRSAASLLLQLAEAETESWSNNATGMFAGLFSLGYGELAPTSLPPADRLPVLLSAFDHGGKRAEIALEAFKIALALQHVTRWGGDQPFRLGKQVKRWQPKTNGEWLDAYKLYWSSLKGLLHKSTNGMRDRIADIFISRARELISVDYLEADVLDTLAEIAALSEYDMRPLVFEIERILSYDAESFPETTVAKLESIRDGLIGASFGSRLRRYAGMDNFSDYFEDGKEVDKAKDQMEQLARDALSNDEQFRAELTWLVTPEAKNGYRFGYTLGKLDGVRKAWPLIVDALHGAGDRASDYFFGGYLNAIGEQNKDEWRAKIRELAQDPRNLLALPALIWRSGLTEDTAQLILELARAGKIEPKTMGIFSMGRAAEPMSDDTFGQWLEFLVGVGTFEAASTAVNLAAMSAYGDRKLSADQILNVISQPALFEKQDGRADVMLTHYWLMLAKSLIKIDERYEMDVLKRVLASMGDRNPITSSLGPEGDTFVDSLVERHPREAWDIISEFVKPPLSTRGFVITRWLRGDSGFNGRDPGPMRHIPRDAISRWIESDPEKRASYVATMAPKDFDAKSWPDSLVRDILRKFGESEKVRSSVFSNFFTGGWSGPASGHYATERAALIEIRDKETDANALRWLDEAIAATTESMERAKIEEEARGY